MKNKIKNAVLTIVATTLTTNAETNKFPDSGGRVGIKIKNKGVIEYNTEFKQSLKDGIYTLKTTDIDKNIQSAFVGQTLPNEKMNIQPIKMIFNNSQYTYKLSPKGDVIAQNIQLNNTTREILLIVAHILCSTTQRTYNYNLKKHFRTENTKWYTCFFI